MKNNQYQPYLCSPNSNTILNRCLKYLTVSSKLRRSLLLLCKIKQLWTVDLELQVCS